MSEITYQVGDTRDGRIVRSGNSVGKANALANHLNATSRLAPYQVRAERGESMTPYLFAAVVALALLLWMLLNSSGGQ